MDEKNIREELAKTLAEDPQNIDRILTLSHSLASFDKNNVRFFQVVHISIKETMEENGSLLTEPKQIFSAGFLYYHKPKPYCGNMKSFRRTETEGNYFL